MKCKANIFFIYIIVTIKDCEWIFKLLLSYYKKPIWINHMCTGISSVSQSSIISNKKLSWKLSAVFHLSLQSESYPGEFLSVWPGNGWWGWWAISGPRGHIVWTISINKLASNIYLLNYQNKLMLKKGFGCVFKKSHF